MELVNLLKEEIKRIASEENINVQKLNEYTRIYERLRAFDVTTVHQVGANQFGNDFNEQYYPVPRMNVGVVPPIANEIGGIFDMLKEVMYDVNKAKGRSEIDEYIWWIKFLKEINVDAYLSNKEVDGIIHTLQTRVIELMKKKLTENIENETKEMEKEARKKDKVIDNVVEIVV